jgi:hypothetical protein
MRKTERQKHLTKQKKIARTVRYGKMEEKKKKKK